MKTYEGGCHCGQIRFTVDMDIKEVMSCNCSICSKKGHLLAFSPEANFRLTQGAAALSDYQFGSKTIHHLFCKNCGIGSFGRGNMPDGAPIVAVNVRCLDNVDIESFPVQKFDGKSL